MSGWTDRSVFRHISRAGIKTSFLLGFGAMALIMVLVATIAVAITARIGSSTRELLTERLPATVDILRVTSAADALAASGASLASVISEPGKEAAFERVSSARAEMYEALNLWAATGSDDQNIQQLVTELNNNLNRQQELVDQRLALISEQQAARERLTGTLEVFQQQLSYRIRILESDSDVMALLMSMPEPPVERVAGMVRETAPLIPVVRFYGEIEAVGGRLLATADETRLSSLELSRQIAATGLNNAAATFARMPASISQALTSAFAELQEITLSENGIVGIRERELKLLAESQMLNSENQEITARVDATSTGLVTQSLEEITLAGDATASLQKRYQWILVAFTAIGLLSLAAFMYLHVMHNLVARLSSLSYSMQNIAAGKFSAPLPAGGDDELGRLGVAVRQFRDIALEAEKREAELETLSASDFLTGLANRRRFDDVLNSEWSRGLRSAQPLALMMIDVDHFKKFNDRYGHQTGDECLKKVADVLSDNVYRASDLAARYGGEEFSIIFANSSLEGTSLVAEKLRRSVAALKLPHADSTYGIVTVSIGVAVLVPDSNETPATLLRAADSALYQAKAGGRNRTASA